MADKKQSNDDFFDLGAPATPSKRYVPKTAPGGGRNPKGPAMGPSGPVGGPSGPMGGPSGPMIQPKKK